MALQIIEDVKNKLEALGSLIVADLGPYGAALIASIKYDAEKAFEAAVAAGKYAADTFVAVGEQALGNFWLTAKAQIEADAKQALSIFEMDGFAAAEKFLTDQLANIDWRAVEVSLTGIGKTTLEAAAAAFLRMLVAGVIAAV